MILRHLRDNVVAYLALTIALGGTSYAAVAIPNGSITNPKLANGAVTSVKIRDNTVGGRDVRNNSITGADIRNRSIGAGDLAVGVVPKDGFVFQRMSTDDDPVTDPDLGGLLFQTVTLPRAGTAHIRLFGGRFSVGCSAGSGQGGMYVDGAPVEGTRRSIPATGSEIAVELVASIPLTAGDHTLAYGVNCPSGDANSATIGNGTWTVVLAAS